MKSKIKNCLGLVIFLSAMLDGNSQPYFYSQSLQKLYYSLPASCRLNTPVAETIADCSGIVPEGTASVVFCWDEHEMLAHIGYRFLRDAEMLQTFNPAIIRFLEREILALLVADNLEQKVAMNRDNGMLVALNGNTPQLNFYRSRTGLPYLLQHVSGMDISYEAGRRYRVDMTCDDGQTLTFQFVADAELLLDMDKKERDDRIAAQLKYHRTKVGDKPQHVPTCSDATMQVYNDSAFVCKGDAFIIPQMNNNLYYTKTNGELQLVFGKGWLSETFSNVMLAPTERNYTVQITHRVYGGETRRYEIKSQDFFDYFSGDYERYFGIETVNKDVLTGTLALVDKNAGNLHLSFVTISVLDLLSGGIMKIQLDTNIPQHNVETLFGKNKETKGEYQFLNQ